MGRWPPLTVGAGPGVDNRALTDRPVREDFLAELALSRGCSEVEAGVVLREALLTGPLAPTCTR